MMQVKSWVPMGLLMLAALAAPAASAQDAVADAVQMVQGTIEGLPVPPAPQPPCAPAPPSDPLGADGPIVPVESCVAAAEDAAKVPVRDEVERNTAGLVPANNLVSYPDYAQDFAKFYLRNARDAGVALVPRDLPRPEPGDLPSVALATVAYVDANTSPQAVSQMAGVLFPLGVLAPWMTDPVSQSLGLDAIAAVGNAPSTVFGPNPPQQGMAPFVVSTAVTEGSDLVLNDNGPGQQLVRGTVAGLLGASTEDLLFDDTVNPPLAIIRGNVACFSTGGATDWAACIQGVVPPQPGMPGL